jgi:hypothetical protein
MGEQSDGGTMFSSATVIAAVIGCVSAVLSAVLPWWLGSHARDKTAAEANANLPVPVASGPITPLPDATGRTLPNLTFGVWTIVEAIDEVGTDFRGSTIKFETQRETADGLELTGSFEWRQENDVVLGQEHFVAHFDTASRQLYIEGQYVESPTGRLAVGSFSARLSDDGRQLVDGTWGNTPNHQAGIPGSWAARR